MQAPTIMTALAVAATGLALGTFDVKRANAAGDDRLIQRVGGDLDVQTELKPDGYRSGVSVVKESLPVGYPAPTPPGAIELKRYPEVRRAEFNGSSDYDRGSSSAFFPLFQHISQREIAMTTPVEVDYAGWSGDARTPDAWTMSFLYRTPDLGPLERSGDIEVVDREPITVVSIGMRGGYGSALVNRGMAALSGWLERQGEWQVAGDPRAFYYNGPSVPDARKWAEVQIPVWRVTDVTDATDATGATDATSTKRAPEPRNDIVSTAASAGSFDTLVAALDAADLVDALRGDGPFTVLAPTDEAFAKLPRELLESLLRPENRATLTAILTYHVVPGRFDAAQLLAKGDASTLQGDPISIGLGDGRVRVNDANVVINDLAVSNGVIHAIDSVLLPPSVDLAGREPLTATRLIELAVRRGAPLFNDHRPDACAAVYELTAEALLAMHESVVSGESRRVLIAALSEMRSQHDPREQAWTLRRALDSTYETLSLPLAASHR